MFPINAVIIDTMTTQNAPKAYRIECKLASQWMWMPTQWVRLRMADADKVVTQLEADDDNILEYRIIENGTM